MKTITMFQTADGRIHNTQADALHYLDEEFGKILCPLAQKIARITLYEEAIRFIEANLDQFGLLIKIKEDMKMEEERDDNDC